MVLTGSGVGLTLSEAILPTTAMSPLEESAMEAAPCVRVIDDDEAVRTALARMLRAAGFCVCTYASAQAFLESDPHEVPGCLVLDLALPGQSGLELQEVLVKAAWPLPVVFLSGRGDVPSSVRAMKAGAVDFLVKPPDAGVLVAVVQVALERGRMARAAREEHASVARRLSGLTPREREVLYRLVQGELNKQIAAALGVSEKTIKVHRARVLQKMAVRSIAGLVRMTARASHVQSGS